MKKKGVLLISSILSSWLFISGCSKTLDVPSEKITLLKGAIAREENGNHTNYNLTEGKYNKVEAEKAVLVYDRVSESYIYEKEGKVFISHKGKDIEIEDENIAEPKISPGGDYYSYFKRDPYMQLVVRDLEKNKEIEINTSVAISGKLMDWTNEKNIVYYGVDKNKVNGIFTYNINTGQEELIYKLENGYLEFLKSSKGGIVFLQETINNKKVLKSIDENGNVKIITENLVELKDIEITEQGTFVLGKMKDNNESVYEIKDNGFSRLIYDFPNIIHMEKGLSCDENGNLLFIGGTDSFDKENVYIYEDGYIKSLTSDNLKYYFVDVQ